MVMACSSVTSCLQQYFEEPYLFRPERWMRNSTDNYHKFASLPFGHGPRKCPGKRLAEQEMVLFLKHVRRRKTVCEKVNFECINFRC